MLRIAVTLRSAGSAAVSGTMLGIAPFSIRAQYVWSTGITAPTTSTSDFVLPLIASIVCSRASTVAMYAASIPSCSRAAPSARSTTSLSRAALISRKASANSEETPASTAPIKSVSGAPMGFLALGASARPETLGQAGHVAPGLIDAGGDDASQHLHEAQVLRAHVELRVPAHAAESPVDLTAGEAYRH